jgi:hypothetical protein
MTNTIQKKFKVSSTQLLYQSCPYQALTLFLIGPFLDGFLTNQNVFAFDYTTQVLVSIKSGFREFKLTVILLHLIMGLHLFSAVFHRVVMPDFSLSKLQYFSRDWEDISCNLPSSWPSENMLGSHLWLCSASRSV